MITFWVWKTEMTKKLQGNLQNWKKCVSVLVGAKPSSKVRVQNTSGCALGVICTLTSLLGCPDQHLAFHICYLNHLLGQRTQKTLCHTSKSDARRTRKVVHVNPWLAIFGAAWFGKCLKSQSFNAITVCSPKTVWESYQ